MPSKEKPNIHQRLLNISAEVTGIAKDARNNFQNFDYVSHSKVLGRIRKLMAKHGVVLTSTIKEIAYETFQDKKGARQMLLELHLLYTFVNVDDPKDTIECQWYSQGTDAGERCVGKALSYSNKYFLLSQFLIPTDRDDPDASDLSDVELDPTEQPMSEEQRKQLRSTAIELFGEAEYQQATRDIATNVGSAFPPKTISDYAVLMADFNVIKQGKEIEKAAKEQLGGKKAKK